MDEEATLKERLVVDVPLQVDVGGVELAEPVRNIRTRLEITESGLSTETHVRNSHARFEIVILRQICGGVEQSASRRRHLEFL